MATHITGTTEEGRYEEWSEDGEEYNPLYFDCEVALRQYTMEADAYGDIEFWFYRSYETCDAEDGWPVVYSDQNGKPSQLLVNLSKQRVGLLSGEIGHWGHCTLHLNRDLRRNEKVWIGIWSIFYTSTFDKIEKARPAATDYLWTYSLGTYREDLETPPPSQAPSEFIKNDWRPLALLPHYFVYSDVSPYQDYVRSVNDTVCMTGVFSRKYRGMKKGVSASVHVTGAAGMHGLLRRYAADSFTVADSTSNKKGIWLTVTELIQAAEARRMWRRFLKSASGAVGAEGVVGTRRRLLKNASGTVGTDGAVETWRTLFREKITAAFVYASFSVMKTLNFFLREIARIRERITVSRVLSRFAGTLVTFWERLTGRRFTNRLEMEFWSPVTTELILKCHIQEDDT